MAIWLVLGVVIACLVWLLASRLSSYRRLFADRHFMEVAQGLGPLRQAAVRNISAADGGDIRPPDDPRILRTSAGLVIVYTISRGQTDGYVHHVSVSIPGRVTAHAVGETFILLWARLLGIGYERLSIELSSATVHHAEFVLDEQEHAEFARRPVEPPTVEWLHAFQADCLSVRSSLGRNRRAGGAV
jgi:hypothetical protein